jgi:superfamily I DNA/RNA helicase
MSLSPAQRAALWDGSLPLRGLWSLSARPGTGKTTTVTRYCLDLATGWPQWYEPWQGMAVLSYTNVAKDEIEAGLRRGGGAITLLQLPHFAGTLDAFINQYLFLAHGAEAMGFQDGRPTLVGEPFQQWRAPWSLHSASPEGAYKPMFFDCYTIGRDNRPLRIDTVPRSMGSGPTRVAQPVTPGNHGKITTMKKFVWAKGMALQADANYLAYQTLRCRPKLAAALARRFPVLVVDEAQDMTEVQHGVLDTLIEAGLTHVVLVGDENQAIYEWNTARPDLFTDRASTPGWGSRTLAETYRCSPAISATLTTMAADDITLVAAADSKNAAYMTPVHVREYLREDEDGAVSAAVDAVADTLAGTQAHDNNATNLKSIAVISRSADDARRLHARYAEAPVLGTGRIVWESPLSREFLRTVHYLECGELDKAVRAYEVLLARATDHSSLAEARAAVMRASSVSPADLVGYRALIVADLDRLAAAAPGTPTRISDCRGLAEVELEALESVSRQAIRRDCARFARLADQSQDRLVASLFSGRDERTWLSHPAHADVRVLFATAHAVKGETYDGVLFHTKHRVAPCGCPQSAGTWNAVLTHSMLRCETKRIAYVACSRAAQSLFILTPRESLNAWQSMLFAADDHS